MLKRCLKLHKFGELQNKKTQKDQNQLHFSIKISMEQSDSYNVKQIISSLSHELRTPLTILSSNLQLLKDHQFKLEEELRKETFQLCEEALHSVTHFLDDIHFLNIANKGELRKNSTKFSIDHMINYILNNHHTKFYHSPRIKTEIHLEDDSFLSDELLLSKAITNLLDNAYKFSGKEVWFKLTNADQCLTIEIEDQGAGIPDGEMDMIFMPFYRCNNVKMLSGSGLGLSITLQAINCLNGEIKIESTLTKGTKVKLKILSDEY